MLVYQRVALMASGFHWHREPLGDFQQRERDGFLPAPWGSSIAGTRTGILEWNLRNMLQPLWVEERPKLSQTAVWWFLSVFLLFTHHSRRVFTHHSRRVSQCVCCTTLILIWVVEIIWLVGALEDFLFFHFIYGLSSFPTDQIIFFQRGRYTTHQSFIELDDGKIYRKTPYFMGKNPYFMGKTHGFRLRFSLKLIQWVIQCGNALGTNSPDVAWGLVCPWSLLGCESQLIAQHTDRFWFGDQGSGTKEALDQETRTKM